MLTEVPNSRTTGILWLSTKPHPAPVLAFWPDGEGQMVINTSRESPTRNNGRCTKRTTVFSTMNFPSLTSTCATGIRVILNGRNAMRYCVIPTPSIFTSTPKSSSSSAWQRKVKRMVDSRLITCVNGWKNTSTHCRFMNRLWKRSSQICKSTRLMPLPNDPWPCITPGIRKTPGCGRFIPIISCM